MPNESSSFRSLKFQDLLPFRYAIEAEDVDTISKLAWSNPRYLIGSGDNPTILHVCTVVSFLLINFLYMYIEAKLYIENVVK